MAKDIYHQMVKTALEKEAWIITDDPYYLTDKSRKIDYQIDLGAEKLLKAENGKEKIAIEIKSFLRASLANEFHSILGQYLIYQAGLIRLEPDRILFLAVPNAAYIKLQEHLFLLDLIQQFKVNLIIFHESEIKELQWLRAE